MLGGGVENDGPGVATRPGDRLGGAVARGRIWGAGEPAQAAASTAANVAASLTRWFTTWRTACRQSL